MTVSSATFIRSSTPAARYEAALQEIIALDRQIFAHGAAAKANADKLFRDEQDEDNVAVLIESGGRPIGYGFAKIVTVRCGGKSIRVFQPLAGLLSQHVGGNAAMLIGIQTCFRILYLLGSPTYMVAFVINPGLYRGLATILDNLYPSPQYAPRSHSIEAAVLGEAIQRWQVPPAPGLTGSEFFVTEDLEVESRRAFTPRCASDLFFLEANPDYQSGRYLGVCARMTWTGMLLSGVRELSRTAQARHRAWRGKARPAGHEPPH